MGEQTKNMLIGVFVIAACALIIWVILFLKPSVGDGKQILFVRFSDVNKIPIGTRVMFAGKPVGEVVSIQPISEARAKPSSDILGHLYYYQLELRIDSHVKVYDTDEISIQTSGLLGEKSIAIIPKPVPKGIIPQLLTSKQIVYAKSVDPLDRLFSEFADLSNTIEKTFQEATLWIQRNGDDLGNTIRAANEAICEIKTAVQSINEINLADQIQTTIQNISATVSDIQDAVRQLEDTGAFVNAGIAMKHLKNSSISIDQITSNLACGRGTIGRLLKSDDLYLHVNALLGKVDILMNDVNNYGILFHLNKSWQRQRIQRITLMNSLDTPDNFKNYFNTEVDQINMSMERISLLIDKMQETPENKDVLKDPVFLKDYAELLRQANELSETLKLYNQQLLDAQSDP
ncbi:MAG TPA: MlaD family protein [Rhabdochlamydiaceae bacterium]|jgi:phospholipid/cholesterol/gamma-HCH transport system substrate-binding protein